MDVPDRPMVVGTPAGGGGWWLTAWAPSYLERLVPQLAADMEIPLSEFSIRNAGLFSADIGPVRLGEGDDGVWLANVHVTYTPASLKRGRIHTVILDGVSLSAVFDGKDFSLPILDQLPATAQSKTQNVPPDLPFDILTLRDAVLLCRINGQDLSVPFSADIEPGENPHFSGQLHPRDQTVEVAGNLALSTNDLSLEVRAKALRVGAFADLLPRPISGEADFSIKTRINLMSPGSPERRIHGFCGSLRLTIPRRTAARRRGNQDTRNRRGRRRRLFHGRRIP